MSLFFKNARVLRSRVAAIGHMWFLQLIIVDPLYSNLMFTKIHLLAKITSK